VVFHKRSKLWLKILTFKKRHYFGRISKHIKRKYFIDLKDKTGRIKLMVIIECWKDILMDKSRSNLISKYF